MCWAANDFVAPKIATKDIKVYKILWVINKDKILSPCFSGCKWDIDVVYELEKFCSKPSMYIHEGFHSLRERPYIKDWSWKIKDSILFTHKMDDRVFKAIIPEGSTYYENKNGEIVSNKLKIVWQQ